MWKHRQRLLVQRHGIIQVLKEMLLGEPRVVLEQPFNWKPLRSSTGQGTPKLPEGRPRRRVHYGCCEKPSSSFMRLLLNLQRTCEGQDARLDGQLI